MSTASAGELRYEVLEDTGDPIPGFTAAECDPISRGHRKRRVVVERRFWVARLERRAAERRYPNLQKEEFLHQVAVLHFSGRQTLLADASPARGHRLGRQGQGEDRLIYDCRSDLPVAICCTINLMVAIP